MQIDLIYNLSGSQDIFSNDASILLLIQILSPDPTKFSHQIQMRKIDNVYLIEIYFGDLAKAFLMLAKCSSISGSNISSFFWSSPSLKVCCFCSRYFPNFFSCKDNDSFAESSLCLVWLVGDKGRLAPLDKDRLLTNLL